MLATLVLAGIASGSDHTNEIVFGYFAYLIFVFLVAPLHLVGILVTVYKGITRKAIKGLGWQAAYYAGWCTIISIVVVDALYA